MNREPERTAAEMTNKHMWLFALCKECAETGKCLDPRLKYKRNPMPMGFEGADSISAGAEVELRRGDGRLVAWAIFAGDGKARRFTVKEGDAQIPYQKRSLSEPGFDVQIEILRRRPESQQTQDVDEKRGAEQIQIGVVQPAEREDAAEQIEIAAAQSAEREDARMRKQLEQWYKEHDLRALKAASCAEAAKVLFECSKRSRSEALKFAREARTDLEKLQSELQQRASSDPGHTERESRLAEELAGTALIEKEIEV